MSGSETQSGWTVEKGPLPVDTWLACGLIVAPVVALTALAGRDSRGWVALGLWGAAFGAHAHVSKAKRTAVLPATIRGLAMGGAVAGGGTFVVTFLGRRTFNRLRG